MKDEREREPREELLLDYRHAVQHIAIFKPKFMRDSLDKSVRSLGESLDTACAAAFFFAVLFLSTAFLAAYFAWFVKEADRENAELRQQLSMKAMKEF